eukprot:Phypoly_transcript_27074.p1 GENE.Phypoly_transcript_27074~~Phypoly_transcript_27074.p1  ORF type:complete len:103 (+),score=20.04 Phypoly_transcript_27074:151-459(+)
MEVCDLVSFSSSLFCVWFLGKTKYKTRSRATAKTKNEQKIKTIYYFLGQSKLTHTSSSSLPPPPFLLFRYYKKPDVAPEYYRVGDPTAGVVPYMEASGRDKK